LTNSPADGEKTFKRHKSLAMVAEGRFQPGTDKVILATLTTFHEHVGHSDRAVAKFFGIEPDHVIVIHDDIDLPFDTVRIKAGGGHGGQNGVRSTIAHLGPDFLRVRVGVGRPSRSEGPAVHVLEPFSSGRTRNPAESHRRCGRRGRVHRPRWARSSPAEVPLSRLT
jgi:peptidyl-tRNA hydrolase, PTH1 family